ncbi:YCII-related [Phaffia rhodozyma]|uniref:YCII-related n=1 Tax=Phaffia rhodozyma TaxID=264483 RepID=A0A0F7SEQ9_PHARH|nr:YCII-related [Phaffia rhodozyma]
MSPNLSNFVIWAPDQQDEHALSRRMAVRTEHLLITKQNSDNGSFVFGGGTLDGHSVPHSPPFPLNGSMFVLKCESMEQVRKIIESDPYYTGNVWDKERIEIKPILLFDPPVDKP